MRWRSIQAKGDMIIVHYADDFLVGFQHVSQSSAARPVGANSKFNGRSSGDRMQAKLGTIKEMLRRRMSLRHLHRPHSQGRKARRPANPAAHESRAENP